MRIASVEAFPIRIPRDLKGATGLAGSPTALAGESDYRWSQSYPALYSIHFETALVRVVLENGFVGWGEAQAPLAPQVACTIIDTLLAPVLVNQEFDGELEQVEVLWNRMYSTMRVRGQTGGFMLDAISGVDLALWDLVGKMQRTPVSSLRPAGNKATKIPAYLSGLPGANAQERVENAKPYVDEGFSLIKLYFDRTPEELFASIDALRAAFPGIEIAVDALWRFSLEEAIEFGKQLDARKIRWLECPLLPESVGDHALLAREIKTPIAIGESYRTVFELQGFLDAGSCKILQPDLGRSGLTEGLRIAKAAAEKKMDLVPHVSIACGPQIAAALHYSRLAPACDLVEYNPRVFEIANRLFDPPIRMEDAHYLLPEGNGLGGNLVEIPTDFLLSRAFAHSR